MIIVVAIFHQAKTENTAIENHKNIEPLSPIKIFGFSKSKIKNIVVIIAKTKNIFAISNCATNGEIAKKYNNHHDKAEIQDVFQEIQSIQFIVFIIQIIQKKSKKSATG